MYIKDSLIKGITKLKWEFEDELSFKFDNDFFGWEKPLYLFFTYFKPKNSTRADLDNEDDCYNILLNQITSVVEDGTVLVTGDLNSRISNLQECLLDVSDNVHVSESIDVPLHDHSFNSYDFVNNNMSINRCNKDPSINDYGYKLIEFCTQCDLAILNGRTGGDKGQGQTTFCGPKGESTVDFVLCDKYTLYNIKDFNISNHVHFSDHKMLTFSMKSFIDLNTCNHNSEKNDGKLPFTFTKWDESKKDSYLDYLKESETILKINELSQKIKNNCNKETLDVVIEDFTNIITKAGSDHVHKIFSNNNHKKGKFWYDEDCQLERIKFLKKKQIFDLNDNDQNRKEMCKQRSIYRKVCRQKRKRYNIEQADNLLILSKKDPKKYWRKLKGNNNKNKNDFNLDFFEHFKNLASKETTLNDCGRNEIKNILAKNENRNQLLDKEITPEELNSSIKNLKRDKSCGNDEIINEFIIYAPSYIKDFLLIMFNTIISLEYVPEKWCIGTIVPIFKSGDKGEVNNYRGITLLSIVCKLFTKIMNSRLNDWAENEYILTESQFGFRSQRGTTDCLFILHGLIEKLLSNGKKLYAAFIDYEKAFDYLKRGAIWAKLIKSGVSSKCIRIFQSLYEKMKLEVRHGLQSDIFTSSTGILQGECTSPIFFSFFVNDLEGSLNADTIGIDVYDILLKLLMYADDMVIFSDSEIGLQDALDQLDFYCSKWGIKVNVRKTKIVVFKKGPFVNNSGVWTYKNEVLEVVPFFKYLGLNFSANGSFAHHFKESVKSAKKALYFLKNNLNKNPEIIPKMQLELFDSTVKPILFYGSEVWGFCKADSLERIYLSFLKGLLCVKQSTPNCFIYGELGVFPLIIERKLRIVKYWFKILNSNENSYLRKMYNELLLLSESAPEQVTWVTLFRDMICQNGFGYIWFQQYVENENNFLRIFEKRLKDIFLQNWNIEKDNTSDFRLFKRIKQSFVFEKYLNISNKTFRIAITKVRLSSHLFFIERGRWRKPKVNAIDRKCNLCNTLEDEYHCLIECPRFAKERKHCLPENLIKRPSMYEFVNLMKCNDTIFHNKLGLLCYKVMKMYKSHILVE